jgi:hypothetical protein
MSITAVVEKGIIKLSKDLPWPPGTVVRIEPVEDAAPSAAVVQEVKAR